MSIAQNDIEKHVAQAVMAAPGLPQVLIIARSQSVLDTLSQEMASDTNVQGNTLCASFVDVVACGGANWDLVNFVVFEISDDILADLNAVRRLYAEHADRLHCVAVSTTPMTEAAKASYLTAGVAEVLVMGAARDGAENAPTPAPTAEEIATSVADGLADAGGDVTVVLRARGGAGATTVAVNLAMDLAAHAKPGEIALIDLDLQNGSIGLALDLADSSEATALIRAGTPPTAGFLDHAMVRHSSGVDVLTAPDVFVPLTAMTSDMISGLIKALKMRYAHIIVDLPQAVLDWTSPVLAEAARVLIVSDMSVPSIKRTRRLIDLISEEHMTLPIRTVVNFEKRPMIPSQVHKEAAHLIGRPLDHWLPNEPRAARRAVDMGVPMRLSAKRSGATKAISALRKSLFSKN